MTPVSPEARRNVAVPTELWKLVAVYAAQEDLTLSQVVTQALRVFLSSGDGIVRREDPSRDEAVPKIDELRALVNAVTAGGATTGRNLLDPVERRRKERERIDRQNYLRTHPEDDSQDPGF